MGEYEIDESLASLQRLQEALDDSQHLLQELKNQNIIYNVHSYLKYQSTSTVAWRSGFAHATPHATSPQLTLDENDMLSSLSRIITTPIERNDAELKATTSQSQSLTPVYHPGPASAPAGTVRHRTMFSNGDKNKSLPRGTLEIQEMIKRLRGSREESPRTTEYALETNTVHQQSTSPPSVNTPQQSSISTSIHAFPSPDAELPATKFADASVQVSLEGSDATARQLALVASLAAATAFGLTQAARKMINADSDSHVDRVDQY